MQTNKTIWSYRNDATGELAPPHRIGTDADGRPLYLSVDGWTPVDSTGEIVAVDCDEDGNWTVPQCSIHGCARWRCDADHPAVVTAETITHMIQIDEETGSDIVWDALHNYAAIHAAPACLRAYVDPAQCWPSASTVSTGDAQIAERWLKACADACGWDERTTPILVIPVGDSEAADPGITLDALRAQMLAGRH